MMRFSGKASTTLVLLCGLMFLSESAEAFRCGNRIIRDGMHEGLVIKLCGEPLTTRPLGLVLRSYDPNGYSVGGLNG
ncbi:MAG: DUF2845 domain-containing protein, partial [Woeseiaceae bacterium]